MHPSVIPLAAILRLNTQLVLNCLADVTDAHANERPGGANSLAFLVAHLIESRHYLVGTLGAPKESPLGQSLARAKTIDDVAELPPLSQLAEYWHAISAHLAVTVERLDTPALAGKGPGFPGTDGTVLGGLAFLTQHDSYHLGQVALLRRQLGYPAMSYELGGKR